jgi:hypothetical protein
MNLTEKLITSFAKTHPLINALFKGFNPEENIPHPTYYFITNQKYNDKLSDLISDLDLFITNTIKYECELLEWPINFKNSKDYPFLGKCLWRRGYVLP